jgi:hypothetical protein
VLARLDDFLDVPVVLIGYSMIRRSLSVRSAHRTMHTRVPTHIICAPSQGISLADVVQMMGRGMGNNRCGRSGLQTGYDMADDWPNAWGLCCKTNNPIGSISLQVTVTVSSVQNQAVYTATHHVTRHIICYM